MKRRRLYGAAKQERDAAIVAEYKRGELTQAQIGARYGLPGSSVSLMCRAAGVGPRFGWLHPAPDDPARAADIRRRYENGEPLAAIGRTYLISRQRAYQIAQRTGAKRPSKRTRKIGHIRSTIARLQSELDKLATPTVALSIA